MTRPAIAASQGVDAVPASALGLTDLPRIDYVDHFAVPTTIDADPERWARAMFGDEPDLGERVIWSVLLGLELATGRSPATVAGWRITGRGEGWVRLAAAGPLFGGNLVVRSPRGEASLTTLLHYRRPPASLVWPPLSAMHRMLVPGVLERAERRLVAAAGSADAVP
ncbi:hypothetical protein GCM10023200_03190 [Actinomycetospora chlora]|uniref:DUF2867 domain-containing protein n=1 Tax=Actinomycetospora chlora TaxID=663608 RepID=A0ABP9A5T5_9PSEU